MNYPNLEHVPRSDIISYSKKKPLTEETWSYLLTKDFGRKIKYLDTWQDTYNFFYDKLDKIKLTFFIDDLHFEKNINTITCLNQSQVNYSYNLVNKGKNKTPIYSQYNEPILSFTLIFKGLRSPEISKTFKCLIENKINYYIFDFQNVFIPELVNILLLVPSHPIISTLFPLYGSHLLDFIEEHLYQSDPQFINLF